MTTPTRLVALVAVAALTLAVGAGCGDDGEGAAEEARAGLTDALGFLRSELGLTDEEVACTTRTIEERLGDGADLDAFADQVRRVDEAAIALSELPEDDARVLTESLASCAGSP